MNPRPKQINPILNQPRNSGQSRNIPRTNLLDNLTFNHEFQKRKASINAIYSTFKPRKDKSKMSIDEQLRNLSIPSDINYTSLNHQGKSSTFN